MHIRKKGAAKSNWIEGREKARKEKPEGVFLESRVPGWVNHGILGQRGKRIAGSIDRRKGNPKRGGLERIVMSRKIDVVKGTTKEQLTLTSGTEEKAGGVWG